MVVTAQLTLIGIADVGRFPFRRAGEVCPAYSLGPFGTGAAR